MSKKLIVFGGNIFYGTPRKQVRAIVASYTKKQAVELLDTINGGAFSYFRYFKNYFCETGNSIELSVATEVGVWVQNDNKITK